MSAAAVELFSSVAASLLLFCLLVRSAAWLFFLLLATTMSAITLSVRLCFPLCCSVFGLWVSSSSVCKAVWLFPMLLLCSYSVRGAVRAYPWSASFLWSDVLYLLLMWTCLTVFLCCSSLSVELFDYSVSWHGATPAAGHRLFWQVIAKITRFDAFFRK